MKTICPSRRTSRRQYDLNSHQTVKWLTFSPRGNGTSNRARFYGKFQHGGTEEEVSEIGEKQSEAKCSKKNKTWSEEELTTFAHVLASNEERDKPWALVLETMALKKSSNEKVFGKILAELKEELNNECVENLDQLRRKYKWFKQEWRKINDYRFKKLVLGYH